MAKSACSLDAEQVQAIAHALADPRRFAILQTIAGGCAVACSAIREEHPISPATVSHHLKELESAGLIELQREGRSMKLSLRRDVWQAYIAQLSNL